MGLVDELPGMAYRCRNDRRWTMEFVSAGCQDLTGYEPEDLIGNAAVAYGELIHADDRDEVRKQVQTAVDEDEPFQIEYRIRTAAGEEKWVWERGRGIRSREGQLLHLHGFIHDVSRRKTLEDRMRRFERLESIGRLAGGVAHDFNNLLTVVEGYAEILAEGLGPGHEYAEEVNEIKKASQKATWLTKQLLAFSRQQLLQPQVLDINEVIYETDKLLRRVLGDNVQLETSLDPQAGNVKLDPGQIQQVLINLAINARDAMPDGGELTIETAPVELDAAYARSHPGVKPGPYAVLSVSDTGRGMTPEVRARIFEPFFTTKGKEGGTGLGLATVYGVVKQSGGFIWVYSELGEGTTFKLHFPRTEEQPTEADDGSTETTSESTAATILLVEDTPEVRRLAARSLTDDGHTVLEAEGSEEALRVLSENGGEPIDLLVADLSLAGEGNGKELALEIVARRPDVKVLFISGYTERAALRREALPPHADFLPKPFSPSQLRVKVREILSETGAAPGSSNGES